MQTTYRLNANELNDQFLEALKSLFKDKEIEIVVNEVDETTYLIQSETNRKRLMESIENINLGNNLVEISPEMLQ
jgi:antitoxin YefM